MRLNREIEVTDKASYFVKGHNRSFDATGINDIRKRGRIPGGGDSSVVRAPDS